MPMKYFNIPAIVAVVVQLLAMIVFMRVVYLDLFLSAGLAALIGFAVLFIGERIAARKKDL